jgi:hypothetical protein
MSHDFTKTLIRAAKRSMSGQSVDLAEVIGKVADLAPEYVQDADISHHLTTALFDLAQLNDAQRNILYDVVRMHQTPEQRRRILAILAFTEVAVLTKLHLWDE